MARRPNWFLLRLFSRCGDLDLLLGFVVVVAFVLLPSVRILASVAVVVVPVALVVSAVLVVLIVLCVFSFDIPHREGGKNFILGCTGRAKKFLEHENAVKLCFITKNMSFTLIFIVLSSSILLLSTKCSIVYTLQ